MGEREQSLEKHLVDILHGVACRGNRRRAPCRSQNLPIPTASPNEQPMIRVAIIDDSPFVQRLLTAYLSRARGVQVIGAVGDADAAIELVARTQPDVITLGVEMPNIQGTELLGLLQLASEKSAVVMVTGVSRRAAATTLEALRLGAQDFHLKFTAEAPVEPEVWERELLSKVRAAHQRRQPRAVSQAVVAKSKPPITPPPRSLRPPVASVASRPLTTSPQRVMMIGGSTGGITAMERILDDLDPATSDAYIIVQHLPAAFTQSLMHQLQGRTSLPIEEARHGTALASGRIYLTPGGCHLRLAQPTPRGAVHIELEDGPAINGHLPCIDATMQSAAALLGPRAVGILLSGMGSDGANGIAAIHAAGGDTMAQDASTCVIFGMPQRAIERQAVNFIGTPEQIARRINRVSQTSRNVSSETPAPAGVTE